MSCRVFFFRNNSDRTFQSWFGNVPCCNHGRNQFQKRKERSLLLFCSCYFKSWYSQRETDIGCSNKKTTLIPIPVFWYFRRSKWYQYSNKKGKWYWYLGRRYSERLFEQHSSVKTKKVTLKRVQKTDTVTLCGSSVYKTKNNLFVHDCVIYSFLYLRCHNIMFRKCGLQFLTSTVFL